MVNIKLLINQLFSIFHILTLKLIFYFKHIKLLSRLHAFKYISCVSLSKYNKIMNYKDKTSAISQFFLQNVCMTFSKIVGIFKTPHRVKNRLEKSC